MVVGKVPGLPIRECAGLGSSNNLAPRCPKLSAIDVTGVSQKVIHLADKKVGTSLRMGPSRTPPLCPHHTPTPQPTESIESASEPRVQSPSPESGVQKILASVTEVIDQLPTPNLMIASDVGRFCNASPQTLPFPVPKSSHTFRIKTGYGQNEETRREGERDLKTPPAQITVKVPKVSPRLPPMHMLNLSTTKVVLLIIIAILPRFGLAIQTVSAQPQYISNRENGQAMIPAKEGSMKAAHGKVETSEQVEDTDRIGRKSERTHPPADPCARNLRWWERIWPASNVHRTLTHATYPKQIMQTTEKSPMAKSTTAKGQTMEKDADTSKCRDMPRAEISPGSPSYLALAQDGHNLVVEILQKKWPKEAEGVKDQKEGIKIEDVKVMVMPSPAKIMCVPV